MKKNVLVGAAIGLFSFFLSATIFQFFRIGGVVFNSGIIAAICTMLLCDRRCAFVAVLLYAVFVDLFVSRLLGVNLSIYLCMLVMLGNLVDEFYVKSVTLPFILLALCTLFYHAFYFVVMYVTASLLPAQDIFRIVAIEMLYNLLVGFFVYRAAFRVVRGHSLGKENV